MNGHESIGLALDAASDRQLARALVVLGRAAPGREAFTEAARAALNVRLPGFVWRLASNAEPDSELLAAVRLAMASVLPASGAAASMAELPQGSTALAELAGELTALTVDALTAANKDDPGRLPDLAVALNDYSNRLQDLGLYDDALNMQRYRCGCGTVTAAAFPEHV